VSLLHLLFLAAVALLLAWAVESLAMLVVLAAVFVRTRRARATEAPDRS